MLSPVSASAATSPDSSLASRAEAIIRREIHDDGPGVAVLIARGDQVVYRGARGRADVELAVPLNPKNIFRIASITKPFTAATILTLVAEGRLSQNDPLSRFIPRYPNGRSISVAQLLDHTAGVSDAWNADPAAALGTPELLYLIAHQAPDFAPGTDWRYSNSGYFLLGAVIEAVTDKPWHVAMHDLLLKPLGLAYTDYHGDAELVYGRALGYSRDDTGVTIRAPYASLTGPAAAGALSSTVEDLFRFVRALATGHVLPAHLYELMTTAKQTSSGQSFNYGFGMMLDTVRGEPVIEHNGGIEGFAAQLVYFPVQEIAVVVLANSDAGMTSPRSLARRLGALAIGRPYRTLRASALDSATLARLAGAYRISGTSTHILLVRDHTLFIRRDDGPMRQLVGTEDGLLFYPGDEIDYYRIIRDKRGRVLALEFYGDDQGPPQREERLTP